MGFKSLFCTEVREFCNKRCSNRLIGRVQLLDASPQLIPLDSASEFPRISAYLMNRISVAATKCLRIYLLSLPARCLPYHKWSSHRTKNDRFMTNLMCLALKRHLNRFWIKFDTLLELYFMVRPIRTFFELLLLVWKNICYRESKHYIRALRNVRVIVWLPPATWQRLK